MHRYFAKNARHAHPAARPLCSLASRTAHCPQPWFPPLLVAEGRKNSVFLLIDTSLFTY